MAGEPPTLRKTRRLGVTGLLLPLDESKFHDSTTSQRSAARRYARPDARTSRRTTRLGRDGLLDSDSLLHTRSQHQFEFEISAEDSVGTIKGRTALFGLLDVSQ